MVSSYVCPYSGQIATKAGDGVLMCDVCDCWGWTAEALKERNDG
jgi:hypothetical protein